VKHSQNKESNELTQIILTEFNGYKHKEYHFRYYYGVTQWMASVNPKFDSL
jgi:hypothetical protein